MIRNYLTVAIRGMTRNKTFTAIRVIGLAAGIAFALLVCLFVQFELSFDTHYADADRIYRVMRESTRDQRPGQSQRTSNPLGEAILAEIPAVEEVVQWRASMSTVRQADTVARASFAIVSESYFEVFGVRPEDEADPLDLLRGSARVLITRSASDRIFGDHDPVGSTISVQGERWEGDFVIAGIIADPLPTSSLRSEFFATQMPENRLRALWDTWRHGSYRRVQTFVKLRQGVDPAGVERQLQPFIEKHLGTRFAKTESYWLQPLLDARLHTPRWPTGDRHVTQVYLFAAAGALLLVIVCVNYVNLSTALASRRGREVGLRKVSGAPRRQLIVQFLGESCLLALLAGGTGAILAYLALPEFNELIRQQLEITIDVLAVLFGLILLVGLAAGAYPAFHLSAFQPTQALKTGGSEHGYLSVRRGLAIFQLAASVVLVIATLTVSKQLDFVAGRDLGFDPENIVALPIYRDNPGLSNRVESAKAEFLRLASVVSASAVHGYNVLRPAQTNVVFDGQTYAFHLGAADSDVWDVYGFEIIEGRSYRDGTEEFVINEAAARALGGDVLGKPFGLEGRSTTGTIVGIVRDYHYQSLHHPVKPLCLRHFEEPSILSVKIAPHALDETMADLRATWKALVPDSPFQHWFADAQVDVLYRADRRMATVSRIATGISIFVAGLGLLALATFATERRTKEIGVRKVLGASVASLLSLLTAEFLQLLLIANLIAWPVGYWVASEFLNAFTYRIDLNIDVFAISGVGSLLLALFIVSLRTVGAAIADPVAALKED